ncbi:uncharacterized protein ANIA_10881 [Aspergillus nidulans FGSC A4]|uniref:Uncharacterized protein n=1 Tax=Emericella nidulans (strain FGSC A4 / ATCC 38163 / CBS 112.46 / NRRL 194 / M139) TaxID=227321 RepID=C8VB82_EMENI|nr:hypothetical protein [Aspergillus nidulans FGSC A4]CBF79327.1 TPA: conserved hypothetical protein [Aspergillus nidulans FGSC A4]
MDESRVSEFMFSAKAMSSLLALSELAAWLAITYIAAAGQVWASALLDLARYRLHGYRENFGQHTREYNDRHGLVLSHPFVQYTMANSSSIMVFACSGVPTASDPYVAYAALLRNYIILT